MHWPAFEARSAKTHIGGCLDVAGMAAHVRTGQTLPWKPSERRLSRSTLIPEAFSMPEVWYGEELQPPWLWIYHVPGLK